MYRLTRTMRTWWKYDLCFTRPATRRVKSEIKFYNPFYTDGDKIIIYVEYSLRTSFEQNN